jgi:hypothetical protein
MEVPEKSPPENKSKDLELKNTTWTAVFWIYVYLHIRISHHIYTLSVLM